MSILSPARFRPMFRLALCGLLALFAAAAVAGVEAPPGAAAPAALRRGAGYHLSGGDFVGYYLTRTGAKVFCIDPGLSAPASVSLTSIGRYPGMSQRTADELAYALSTWGNPTTRAQAAVESQLLNTIAGHADAVRRRAARLPRAVSSLVAAHLRTVRALSGPYAVGLRASRAASPGQVATGSATVVSAARVGVPGLVIQLHGSSNVVVPSAVRSDAHGSASFRYTVTGPGPVRIDATAGGLAPSRFTGTHPAAGQQRMVTWAHAAVASAHVGFQARLGAFSHSYACTTTCNGHPSTTLGACAAPSAYVSRLTFRTGASTRVLDFPASNRSRCRSFATVLGDRDQVTAGWTFLGRHGWTVPVAAAGAFVVDCPAVPVVRLALSYDCAQGSLTAEVTAPTTHPAVLVIAGAAARRLVAAAGGTARFTTAVQCAAVQTFMLQAGVQRAGGGWNYGPAARIDTPGAARQP